MASSMSSLYKAQFALRLCENHDKKDLQAYCKTCEKKICSICIKEDHNQHDWETITDILREKRRSLPVECTKLRTTKLKDLKNEIDRFDRKIQTEDVRFKRNKSVLNSSRKSYIDNINKLFDYKIEVCRQKSEEAIQMYSEERDGLKRVVEHIEMMTTALDKDINTLPDHDILDMEKEMKDELEKALSYSADKYVCTTVFVPGVMDVQALENMIGELHSVSVEEMYDIDRNSDALQLVKPVSDTQVWVRTLGSRSLILIDKTGKEMKTLEKPHFDLISKDGDSYLTNNKSCIISVLNDEQVTIRKIDTKPLRPTWISKTENDDILVTLKDGGSDYNLVPKSRRIVRRMTLRGKVLHTYEFREDAKTRLFKCPSKTAENKNTDICVVNLLSDDVGELVIMHKDGRVKFTYDGDGLKTEKFLPLDVECDSKCRILFTEYYSRAIHMLSVEGMHLCTLCQYDKLHPFVISIYDDYLWCGFREGRVKMFKYTQ